ncbi:acylphosphatase [Candidatus Uhrbacteria bacterium]|nr:acylphosphatase [Candidatus Uhrbacteria bacterium]
MKVRTVIHVYGRVQGVGYRYAVVEKAQELSLCGCARNEKDGSVYIEVEGDQKAVHEFLRWSRRGPSGARVDKVDFFLQGSLEDYKSFLIFHH